MENRTIGAAIADLRKKKGMTQAELAELMGVTDKAVSKWERDISCPDVSSLPRLAELLGVSADELLRAKTGEHAGNPAKKTDIGRIIDSSLSGVALAEGVFIVVGSAMNIVTLDTVVPLIGIGMTCLGLLAVKRINADK